MPIIRVSYPAYVVDGNFYQQIVFVGEPPPPETVTSNFVIEIGDFSVEMRGGPTTFVTSVSSLYPFETEGDLVRAEYGYYHIDLADFEVDALFRKATTISVEPEAAKVLQFGWAPVFVGAPLNIRFNTETDLPGFEVEATVVMPVGVAFRPDLPDFESEGTVEVQTAIRFRIELPPFETSAIILNPPITTEWLLDLPDFESSAFVSSPYRIYSVSSLPEFETAGLLDLGNLFKLDSEIPAFEVRMRAGSPANWNITLDVSDFDVEAFVQNNSTASATIFIELYDFESPLNFKQTLEVNGALVAPAPFIEGEIKRDFITISGEIWSPALIFIAEANLRQSIIAELVSPIPYVDATAQFSAWEIEATLTSPAPFIEGQAELARLEVAGLLTPVMPYIAGLVLSSPYEIGGILSAPLATISGTLTPETWNIYADLRAPIPSLKGLVAAGTRLVLGNLVAPSPTIYASVVWNLDIAGILFAPAPFLDGYLSAPAQINANFLAPPPFITAEAELSYRVTATLIAPQPFIRGRIKKVVPPGEPADAYRHFNISLGIRL